MSKETRTAAATGLDALPRHDLYVARLFAMLTASLHAAGLVARQSRYLNSDVAVLASQTVFWVLAFIGVALLAAALSLWSRKVKGLAASMSALLAAGVGYLIWYLFSWQDLAVQASNPFYERHPEAMIRHTLGFIEAKWWDFIVLTMVVMLFLWETKSFYILHHSRSGGFFKRG
jgi:hypothetical protein